MKVIKQSVYRVTFSSNYDSDRDELVEANSLVEAIEVSTAYHNEPNFKIKGVNEYMSILKPISKTITQTLTVEL